VFFFSFESSCFSISFSSVCFWPVEVRVFWRGQSCYREKNEFLIFFCFQAVFNQSQGQEWGRGGGSVGGQRGMRKGGGDKRHSQIPTELVVRGGRRQSTCQPALHMSQRTYALYLRHMGFCILGTGYHRGGSCHWDSGRGVWVQEGLRLRA